MSVVSARVWLGSVLSRNAGSSVNELPGEYLRIGSALGEAAPNSSSFSPWRLKGRSRR